jgi:drug/metabolite transporter (DMT)-like permease
VADTDAEATSTLLRAPAAVIAAAYVLGLTLGELSRPISASASPLAVFAATALICAPFLMPSRWFRAHPAALWIWMAGAAALATARAVAMALWLYSPQPDPAWFVKALGDLFVAGLLWMAAVAVWRKGSLPRVYAQ